MHVRRERTRGKGGWGRAAAITADITPQPRRRRFCASLPRARSHTASARRESSNHGNGDDIHKAQEGDASGTHRPRDACRARGADDTNNNKLVSYAWSTILRAEVRTVGAKPLAQGAATHLQRQRATRSAPHPKKRSKSHERLVSGSAIRLPRSSRAWSPPLPPSHPASSAGWSSPRARQPSLPARVLPKRSKRLAVEGVF